MNMATNSLVSPSQSIATHYLHSLSFIVTLCLVMLELLVGQIHKEVMTEQKKMSWVPVQRDY